MNEINIDPNKLVSAYRYLNSVLNNFPKVNEVNIPSSISTKLNTYNYYNKLQKAKKALEGTEIIDDVEKRIKAMMIILARLGIIFSLDTFLGDIIDDFSEEFNDEEYDLASILIDDGVSIETGTIVNIEGQWRTSYKIYIPKKISKDTDITVFYPGTDGIEIDSSNVLTYAQNNPDQIVFMSYASDGESAKPMLNNIKYIINEYGLKSSINVFGFSRGAQFGEKFARDCIESDIDVKNLILVDPADNGSSLDWQTNESAAKILNDAGTNVIVFSHNGNDFMKNSSYKKATASGLEIKVVGTARGHNEHITINQELIENGALDYFRGKGKLKNIQYYTVLSGKDSNGNNIWREMTLDDLENYIKIN